MTRTEPLANPAQPASAAMPAIHTFGTFLLGADEYAIEMEHLQEVVGAPESLQRMPLAPPALRGLFKLRSRVVPVLESRTLMQLPPVEPAPDQGRMAIIEKDGALVGLLFDRLGEVSRVRASELTAFAPKADDSVPVRAVFSRGGSRLVQVLDPAALFSIRNLPQIKDAAPEGGDSHLIVHRLRDLLRDKLIGFTVGGCQLAIEMRGVRSIEGNLPRQRSPHQSELCEEVVQIRGQIVPVVKTSRLLRLGEQQAPTLLVCELEGRVVAFEVEQANQIIPYSAERILPIPVLDDYRARVFRGCFASPEGQDFIVINEQGLLSRPEIEEIAAFHQDVAASSGVARKDANGPGARRPVLSFRLGRSYCLPLESAVEVLPAPSYWSRLPDMPAAVLGMVNRRGTPLPVLDPRALYGIQDPPAPGPARIVVFDHEGKRMGMKVDALDAILQVAADKDDKLPDLFFQEEQDRFSTGFERALRVTAADGSDTAVILLRADDIYGRLAAALTDSAASA